MPRERHFRQSDVTAAVKAVEKAGKSVARVEIDPDGTVTLFTDEPEGDSLPVRRSEALERFRNALPAKRQTRARKSGAA